MAGCSADTWSSATGLDSSFDTELSWVSCISRTRISTVDGLNLTDSVHHGMVQSLEGILQAVQKLKIKRYPFDEIEEIRQVGHGETFRVVQCRLKNELVAIKHVKLEGLAASASETAFRRRLQSVTKEVLIMHHTPLASHPNILNLLGYGWQIQEGRPAPYVLVDYGDRGSLRQFLVSSPQNLRTKMVLGGDVACGLMALHACGIVHGDVKLDNVVVFSSPDRPSGGQAKICDFGHSILLSESDRKNLHYYGTALYNAPEIALQASRPIDSNALHKCDIWAFGLLIWEILLDGARYFRREWRRDANLMRSIELSSPVLPGQDRSASKTNTALLETEDVDDDNIFGNFDPAHLKTLAKDCVKCIQARNSEFEKGYLRALFEQSLQPNPDQRLSDLSRSPLISRYYNKVASTTALQASMAMHTGHAGFTYDLFLRERSQYITWVHEIQILQDIETTCASSQHTTNLPAALFHAALCFINAFGTSRNDTKACQYLQKAQERGHSLAQMVWQRLSNVISTIPAKVDLSYQRLLRVLALEGRRCVRSSRIKAMWSTASEIVTEYANYDAFLSTVNDDGNYANYADMRVILEIDGSTLMLNLLETAIAFEDHDLVAKVRHSFDLGCRGAWNETPFQQAARFGNMRLLKPLLEVISKTYARQDLEAFYWLFCLPDVSAIEQCLNSSSITKAQLNTLPASSTTIHAQWPLKLEGTLLAAAVMVGDDRVVAALLEYGADPLAPAFAREINGDIWTPVHLAARNHQANILQLMQGYVLKSDASITTLISLPLSCALSHATPAERMVIHGANYETALQNTISILSTSLEAHSAQGRTALFQAIDFEDYQVTDALLRENPALASMRFQNPKDAASWTYPLHFASQIASQRDTDAAVSIVQRLLMSQPHILDSRSADGSTALHLACSGAYTRALQYLLGQGAKPNIFDHKGQTALHKCRSSTGLKMLLDYGANPELGSRLSGTAIHGLVVNGSVDQVRELLNHGASIHTYCESNGSVLHTAVRSGSREMVQLVIDAGGQVDNTNDPLQRTPLMLAVELRQIEIGIFLLEAGANCFAIRDGRFVLQTVLLAETSSLTKKMLSLLPIEVLRSHWRDIIHDAVKEYSAPTLKMLLRLVMSDSVHPPFDLNVTLDERTPLHIAALFSRADSVAVLLEYGAHVNVRDKDGNTPLLLACDGQRRIMLESSCSSTCLTLLSNGASITDCNDRGQSCLLLAQRCVDFELMTIFLRTASKLPPVIHTLDGTVSTRIHVLCEIVEPMEPYFRSAFVQKEWDFITICIAHRLVPETVVSDVFKFTHEPTGTHKVTLETQVLALEGYARNGDRSMVEYVASTTFHEIIHPRSGFHQSMDMRIQEWRDSIFTDTGNRFLDRDSKVEPELRVDEPPPPPSPELPLRPKARKGVRQTIKKYLKGDTNQKMELNEIA